MVWTNSSFKSELKHPWLRFTASKNCHFRFHAWCIKHIQESGLPHSFPWYYTSLWRAPSHKVQTLGRRWASILMIPSTVMLAQSPFSASIPGQTGMSDKKSWEVLFMHGSYPRRKWRSSYNLKESSAKGTERKQKLKLWCMYRCIHLKANASSLAWYFLSVNQDLLLQTTLRIVKKCLHCQGNSCHHHQLNGCTELVHVCT